MSYTNLQLVRKKLADDYKLGHDESTSDGHTDVFKLSHGNVQDDSYSVYVNDTEMTEFDNYTLDKERGIITFTSAPLNNETIDVRYYYSAFSDDEINEFLLQKNNDINKTILELIEILLADAARRFDYSSAQTTMQPSQVFSNLQEMHSLYSSKSSSDNSNSFNIVKRRHPAYSSTRRSVVDLSREDLG